MIGPLRRYARWLHLRWPAGLVEPAPAVREDGATSVAGVYVAGDLAGVPLLKSALESGARVMRAIAADAAWRAADVPAGAVDVVIVGAGPAGVAAAAEARKLGLSFRLLESAEAFSTIANFPRAKPIFTYPRAMTPTSALQVRATVKETLLDELRAQAAVLGIAPEPALVESVGRAGGGLVARLAGGGEVHARRAVLAIGRSGEYRRLGVPGEDLDLVSNRLHDPGDFAGRRVLVAGGGDSALETASALAEAGAAVTLAHRGEDLARAKPENIERVQALASADAVPAAGRIAVRLRTTVRAIAPDAVRLVDAGGRETSLAADAVFTMIGRTAPLEFLRRCGVAIAGEWTRARLLAMAAFMLGCAWLYDWKSGGYFSSLWYARHWFPTDLPERLRAAGGAMAAQAADPHTLLGTLAISASGPSFWYTLAYSTVVVVFGLRRIRRRRTPYITAQTLTLMAVQVGPLFLLPEVLLPLMGAHGWLPRGLLDALFPVVGYGHGREYWRAYGLVLAWPLDVYNVFTHQPLGWWLAISFVQTCVLIPFGVYLYGKGAYCGWVCSCGALAETLGDTHRHKMPHGPGWNRLQLAGQALLGLVALILLVRIAGWLLPAGNWADRIFEPLLKTPYQWTIDVFLAGVVGYGVYFWYSGRFWCRFFCPLAALMHVYARFSRFRILAEKKKCISCGQCTAVCHQGIDVMRFANRGAPMADPECVRCSACVHVCPTGVLRFGQVDGHGVVIGVDQLLASPVQRRESD